MLAAISRGGVQSETDSVPATQTVPDLLESIIQTLGGRETSVPVPRTAPVLT